MLHTERDSDDRDTEDHTEGKVCESDLDSAD